MAQLRTDGLDPVLVATHLPDLNRTRETALLHDIVDIAQRALWNPAKVSHAEIQKLASAVVAHVEREGLER